MQWTEIRQAYPDQWLIIKALQAHTTADSRRRLDKIAIIERCQDGTAAMQSYRRMHQQYPAREFYFVHTSREELDIRERQWSGIRMGLEHADEYDASEYVLGAPIRCAEKRQLCSIYLSKLILNHWQ